MLVLISQTSEPAQSAELLEGLEHPSVEQARLPAALLSDQNTPVRSRPVDQDQLSLEQAELGVRLGEIGGGHHVSGSTQAHRRDKAPPARRSEGLCGCIC